MVDIERINFLAKKQREEGLTDEEKAEQAKLRREYIDSVVGNLRSQLDNTYVVEGDKKTKLERVEKPGKEADGEPVGSPNKPN
ncbi:MAG: DUF896 domain-containing protein [Clostridia bacterium]|nr:DUF896 domain-containing protein [Clostridiales bacterium]MDD7166379.1 DUF896 domain-containing protein [Clostridia bacterium]MDY2901694.1 DUF896 domain-containing protein [Christensenellaceae bacterium]